VTHKDHNVNGGTTWNRAHRTGQIVDLVARNNLGTDAADVDGLTAC
jgi:hypothetical protein